MVVLKYFHTVGSSYKTLLSLSARSADVNVGSNAPLEGSAGPGAIWHMV